MKHTIVIIAALALGGCAALTGTVPLPSLASVYKARLAYDTAFLPAAVNYRRLPLCADGTHFTLAVQCSEKSVVIKLQKADKTAVKALDDAEAFVRSHPGTNASAPVLEAATFAVSEAIALISPYASK